MKGERISRARLKDEIQAGISIGLLVPGLVPEYHVMAAAQKAGYRYYNEWQLLAWKEKASLVAHYFAGRLLEQHMNAAINRAMERKQRRGKKKK